MRTPFDRFTAPAEEARIRSLVDRVLPQWVTPNGITYTRLTCTPVVLALMVADAWTAALVLYIIGMLLDAFDGPLARARNQVTNHGKLLDPIADKIAVFLPFWMWWLLADGHAVPTVSLMLAGVVLTGIECTLLTIRLRALAAYAPLHATPQANGVGKAKVWVEGWMVGVTLCGPREPIAHAIALALAIIAIILACGSWYGHRHASQ